VTGVEEASQKLPMGVMAAMAEKLQGCTEWQAANPMSELSAVQEAL